MRHQSSRYLKVRFELIQSSHLLIFLKINCISIPECMLGLRVTYDMRHSGFVCLVPVLQLLPIPHFEAVNYTYVIT